MARFGADLAFVGHTRHVRIEPVWKYLGPVCIGLALAASVAFLAPAAGAVRTGFIAEAEDWSLSEDELAWWLGVAEVQFAQWRLEREGQPGVQPWLDAVTVVEAALHDD